MTDHDFSVFCLPWQSTLVRYVSGLSRNTDVARDVVQDTMLSAFTHWGSWQPVEDPAKEAKAWLFRIATNRFFSVYRRKQTVSLADASKVLMSTYGTDLGYYQQDFAEGMGDECAAALGGLDAHYRDTVERVHVRGQSYAKVAEDTGVPIGTVMSRLFRGRAALKEPLAAYAAHEYGIRSELDGAGQDAHQVEAAHGEQTDADRVDRVVG